MVCMLLMLVVIVFAGVWVVGRVAVLVLCVEVMVVLVEVEGEVEEKRVDITVVVGCAGLGGSCFVVMCRWEAGTLKARDIAGI